MKINVLGIEENVNSINDIKKYVKNSTITLINIPHQNSFLMDKSELKYFKSKNVLNQLNELELIKNNFDLCIVSSWRGARLAYLAGLKFIINFVGNDIRIPPFIKNSKANYFNKSVNGLNFLQRKFYKKIFDDAAVCVGASDETFGYIEKYRKDGIRIDRTIVDTELFNLNVKPLNIKKQKFTFFCPQRIGLEKGTDILWEAIKKCKSDFEVIQCEWYDETSQEAYEKSQEILKKKPIQVKFIPKIPREALPKYYAGYDAILGEMRLGLLNNIEREAAFLKKPIVCYYNLDFRYLLDGNKIIAPFLPNSNKPEEIAKIIDKIVESKDFRDELASKEYEFIKDYANPDKAAREWDHVFEKTIKISKFSNNSRIKRVFRYLFYILSHGANRKDVTLS